MLRSTAMDHKLATWLCVLLLLVGGSQLELSNAQGISYTTNLHRLQTSTTATIRASITPKQPVLPSPTTRPLNENTIAPQSTNKEQQTTSYRVKHTPVHTTATQPTNQNSASNSVLQPSHTIVLTQLTSYDATQPTPIPTVLPPHVQVPYLLFANRGAIRRINIGTSGFSTVTSNETHLSNAIAVDFDIRQNRMFWTDVQKQTITQSTLEGTNATVLVDNGVTVPDGLSWDWVNEKLYWTDAEHRDIEVMDPHTLQRRRLVYTGADTIPRAIVVDPTTRWLYWTDWSTEARIERASMDGTLRQTIVTTGLVWPNGLTIDFDSQKLYWVDASLHKIETANTDGTNRVLLTTNSIFHPFSITFYGGVLYWSDWSVNNILQMSTEAPDNVTTLLATQLLRDPMGVHMVTESRQPPVANPCAADAGSCSYLCLLSAANPAGYSCSCPEGMTLQSNQKDCSNGSTPTVLPEPAMNGSCVAAGYSSCCSAGLCLGEPPNCFCDAFCHDLDRCCTDITSICPQEDTPLLIFANRRRIYQVNLNGTGLQELSSNETNAVALDFHYGSQTLYWSDVTRKVIRSSKLDGSDVRTLIHEGLQTPDGLAVDWLSDKLYWTDAVTKFISVYDLYSGLRKELIATGNRTVPRGIVVDPQQRWLYWTDWGDAAAIERASMDGSNRTVLHNTALGWPNAITLDHLTHTLYWADASLDRIESSNTIGADRKVITSTGIEHPFSMAFFEDTLYWSDWQSDSVLSRGTRRGQRVREVVRSLATEPMGVAVVTASRQLPGLNPCAVGNGGCEQLCLLSAVREEGYSCACADGHMALNGDSSLCTLADDTATPATEPNGSCVSAGHAGCCNEGLCEGEPANCFCDVFCFSLDDCCSDFTEICPINSSTSATATSVAPPTATPPVSRVTPSATATLPGGGGGGGVVGVDRVVGGLVGGVVLLVLVGVVFSLTLSLLIMYKQAYQRKYSSFHNPRTRDAAVKLTMSRIRSTA